MKHTLTAVALVAASLPLVLTDSCTKSSLGNWYCNQVKAVSFTGFGAAGTFNKVTNMDSNTGACASVSQSYSGGMAPLDGEISWHFRGPMHLKEFAHYIPGGSDSSKPKRDIISPALDRRHGHYHDFLHERSPDEREAEKRGVGDWVTATINGVVASWQNQYAGGGGSGGGSAAAPTAAPAPAVAAAVAPPSSSYTPALAPTGSWSRSSYYSAFNATAQNLVFLNNKGGGSVSGVFDYKFGNSLSYASSDGTATPASSNQILQDVLLGDSVELALFSGKPCGGSDCGFYRPGTVAYHGFGGSGTSSSKMFLLEFSMPLTGAKGNNLDIPAVWILNALIPRTAQYGSEACSCWKSGCGELDVFEVLESGDLRGQATFQGGADRALGNSDYFARPTEGTVKILVVMDGGSVSIVEVDGGTSFDQVLNADVVRRLTGSQGAMSVKAVPPPAH